MTGVEIDLCAQPPLDLMSDVERRYVQRFGEAPEDPGGWYDEYGWRRISRVFERLDKGGDLIDVGAGAGQFVNCAGLSGEFSSVTATDPTRFKKYIELSEQIQRFDYSIDDLQFADDSFDVVTCMEVLEHLPDEVFARALPELRRICRGQLIVTVPYCEPEPISRTHVRRFEDRDFARLFPYADFAVLRRPNKPWMLVEEWPNRPARRVALEVDGEILALESRVLEFKSQVHALESRKSLRIANWIGRRIRRALRTLRLRRVSW